MTIKQQIITSIGVNVLQERIVNKTTEIADLLSEIKTQREGQSSDDDNPDISIITARYEKAIQERNDLQNILSNAVIIDVTKITDSKVVFGSVVTIEDLDTGAISTYRVVSPIESDIAKGRISYESPVGKAMIGLAVGNSFEFGIRGNIKEYEIMKIEIEEINNI